MRATRASQKERAKFAREHAAALEKKLSYVTVDMPAVPPGTTVRLGDRNLVPEIWGTPIPVDPGWNLLEVTAPHKLRWEQRIRVADGPSHPTCVGSPAPRRDPDVRCRLFGTRICILGTRGSVFGARDAIECSGSRTLGSEAGQN